MTTIHGRIHEGNKDFTKRMTAFSAVFAKAVGEELFPGTLNVQVDEQVKIREHFRIPGAEIDEPEQDLLFEICRVNRHWAHRVRPLNRAGVAGMAITFLKLPAPFSFGKSADLTTRISASLFFADGNGECRT